MLTSRYARSLPRDEMVDGVRIVRVPVLARVSKGVIMPIMLWALREARRHDVVSIHLPQFDGAAVALSSRLLRRPTVLTYHCDLRLPVGFVNRIADAVVFAMNYDRRTPVAPHRRLHPGLRRPLALLRRFPARSG